jgi:hypothetical protein
MRPARQDDGLPDRLGALWGRHVLADDVIRSFDPTRAWVLEDEGGRLLAAMQVRPERWTVTAVPGRGGGLLHRLLPGLGPLLPAFRGHDLSYLRLSHLWAAPGQHDALRPLLSAVLHGARHHAAVHFGDPRCATTTRLRGAMRPGLLGRIGVEPEAHVMVGAKGVDLGPWDGRPVWIPPSDPA